MNAVTQEEHTAVAHEWREAGQPLSVVTRRLVHAFQDGWSKEPVPAEQLRFRDQLHLAARQMDHAAEDVRKAFTEPETQLELDRAGALARKAVSHTRKVLRKDIDHLLDALDEPE